MSNSGWGLTGHICRHCGGGRLLEMVIEDTSFYICSNCEREAEGTHDELCYCGLRLAGHDGKEIDPGVRCHRRETQLPGRSVIVASARAS